MNLAKQGKKFDELLDKLNYTDDQKAYVYLTITQFVDRQLEDLIIATLSQEDMDHIESLDDEEEAHEYIGNRLHEETGQDLEETSDEYMLSVLERAQVEGIKELLNHIQELI